MRAVLHNCDLTRGGSASRVVLEGGATLSLGAERRQQSWKGGSELFPALDNPIRPTRAANPLATRAQQSPGPNPAAQPAGNVATPFLPATL
ncbi:hypothetical protein MRX96_055880 [Rhipicephalus microplus]